MSVNEVRLIGNVGRDPDVSFTKSNDKVVTISVATSESWKNKQGEWQEKTEWHRVKAWRYAADKAEKLSKGVQVYIEGKNETHKWEDENGKAHYSTEVVAHKIMALGRENEGGRPAGVGDSGHFEAPKIADQPDDEDDSSGLPF